MISPLRRGENTRDLVVIPRHHLCGSGVVVTATRNENGLARDVHDGIDSAFGSSCRQQRIAQLPFLGADTRNEQRTAKDVANGTELFRKCGSSHEPDVAVVVPLCPVRRHFQIQRTSGGFQDDLLKLSGAGIGSVAQDKTTLVRTLREDIQRALLTHVAMKRYGVGADEIEEAEIGFVGISDVSELRVQDHDRVRRNRVDVRDGVDEGADAGSPFGQIESKIDLEDPNDVVVGDNDPSVENEDGLTNLGIRDHLMQRGLEHLGVLDRHAQAEHALHVHSRQSPPCPRDWFVRADRLRVIRNLAKLGVQTNTNMQACRLHVSPQLSEISHGFSLTSKISNLSVDIQLSKAN